jgi:ATP-binding cassette subfamily F protein 3
LMLEPYNLLILDEPTNHLDIASKEVLRQAIMEYEGTLLLVSHDRAFMRDMFSEILIIEDKKLNSFIGGLDEFLEKNQAESVRMFESGDLLKAQKAKKEPKEKVAAPQGITKDEKRRQQSLKKVERDMESLNATKKELEKKFEKMTGTEPEYRKHMEDYAELKRQLEEKEEKWLDLSE